MLDIPIVFEDETLLVINKPAQVVVNKAESVIGETIQDWADEKLKIKNEKLKIDEESDFYKRAGIVHRLDKETSGLLIIAKTPQAFFNLQTQFKDRKISKKYTALVHGDVKPPAGEVRANIGRLPWNRERFGILPAGKEATTKYKVIAYYKFIPLSSQALRGDLYESVKIASPVARDRNDTFSLLEVTPATGRTHQIRVHLKYLGHSIVSDMFYAGRKVYREDKIFCPRLFLHASYLKFKHPVSEKEIEVKSKLPVELKKVLDGLERNELSNQQILKSTNYPISNI
ncbi:RluA family pseudouridine synthase [Candidatus Gottesmanbacteria bacterium]|nr:RluA family pseudouridine synthase [Candidatus Gottesmanbacteria bacterium]MBI5451845.1 RluA family pseudouridine synthase [Candidatus Gottesmanbacteria bacterium]